MGEYMSELILYYRGQPVLRETLTARLTIGRETDCDIRLLDSVASHHARIEVTPKGVVLVELEGPVHMDGKRVAGSEVLQDGDVFDIGTYRLHFLEGSCSLSQLNRVVDETITSHGREVSQESSTIPTFVILAPFKKQFSRIGFNIGRSPACDLQVDNPYISTCHCEIFVKNGRYCIRDLASRNGTFVNDCRVTDAVLPPTGTIRIGHTVLTYQIEYPDSFSGKIPGIIIPNQKSGDERRIVYQSSAMARVIEQLQKIAARDDSILLLGETGVGKDVLASLVHALHPKRKIHPLIVSNCATITSTLAESLLFGHIKGSFTGAISNQPGYFEQADHGTLFLDEIGELPPDSQARILRVLEDRMVRPVGGDKSKKVDVRIIAATNQDLEKAQKNGSFRRDLYERFDWIINIPALRDRPEDIEPLARYFISALSPCPLNISSKTISFLRSQPWPGNVRALQRAIRVAITSALSVARSEIMPDDFMIQPARDQAIYSQQDLKTRFLAALTAHRGVVRYAVRDLGISSKTAYALIKMHQIDLEALRGGVPE